MKTTNETQPASSTYRARAMRWQHAADAAEWRGDRSEQARCWRLSCRWRNQALIAECREARR